MLTEDDILKRLQAIRLSPRHERNARRITSINAIARRAGLNRTYLHNIIAGTTAIGPSTRRKLSDALTCHENEGKRPVVPPAEPSISIRFSVAKWLQ